MISVGVVVIAAASSVVGTATIVDGDSLTIDGQQLRLHGIDAPERNQTCRDKDGRDYPCGRLATKVLEDLVNEQTIRCDVDGRDRYDRLIGTCYTGNTNLNVTMVTRGYAVAYRRYSVAYVTEERLARRNNTGLWRGELITPEAWRRGERLPDRSSFWSRVRGLFGQ